MGTNMADIARAAGVSIATVGRVIHNNGYVSPDARARVERAVRELGYVPNALARALRKNRSGVIGSLVVYNLNNLFQKINDSVTEAAERRGYELVTIEARWGRGDEERIIRRFIGMRVDAVVITSNRSMRPDHFRALRGAGIPAICVERTYEGAGIDNLTVLDFEGAREAVARMIARGHRRIGLIAKQLVDEVEKRRHAGYLAALADAGIAPDAGLIRLMPQYGIESGYQAMGELLALAEPPSCVFATADTMAAGAMQKLCEAGLRVPGDVSIAGYDNVLSAALSPPVDSVDLAAEDIGETVMELIERRLGNPDAPSENRPIPTHYVDRGTVRVIPNK